MNFYRMILLMSLGLMVAAAAPAPWCSFATGVLDLPSFSKGFLDLRRIKDLDERTLVAITTRDGITHRGWVKHFSLDGERLFFEPMDETLANQVEPNFLIRDRRFGLKLSEVQAVSVVEPFAPKREFKANDSLITPAVSFANPTLANDFARIPQEVLIEYTDSEGNLKQGWVQHWDYGEAEVQFLNRSDRSTEILDIGRLVSARVLERSAPPSFYNPNEGVSRPSAFTYVRPVITNPLKKNDSFAGLDRHRLVLGSHVDVVIAGKRVTGIYVGRAEVRHPRDHSTVIESGDFGIIPDGEFRPKPFWSDEIVSGTVLGTP